MGLTLAGYAYLASAAATAVQYKESGKAAAASKEAQQKQEATEQVALAESRRQQIRQERVRRAEIMQRAETLGVGGASGEAGALGSLSTQTGASLAFQTGQGEAAKGISESLQKAADFKTSAANAGAAANLSSTIFTEAGGFESIFNSFK